jgi:hypothetical protein
LRGLLLVLATIVVVYPLAFGLVNMAFVAFAGLLGFSIEAGLDTPQYGKLLCYGLPSLLILTSLSYWYRAPSITRPIDEVRIVLGSVAMGLATFVVMFLSTAVIVLIRMPIEGIPYSHDAVQVILQNGLVMMLGNAVVIAMAMCVVWSTSQSRRLP